MKPGNHIKSNQSDNGESANKLIFAQLKSIDCADCAQVKSIDCADCAQVKCIDCGDLKTWFP